MSNKRSDFQNKVMAALTNNTELFFEDARCSNGSVVVKRSYFYTFGESAQTLENKVRKALNAAQNIPAYALSSVDKHANWPKTSYWVVTVAPSAR